MAALINSTSSRSGADRYVLTVNGNGRSVPIRFHTSYGANRLADWGLSIRTSPHGRAGSLTTALALIIRAPGMARNTVRDMGRNIIPSMARLGRPYSAFELNQFGPAFSTSLYFDTRCHLSLAVISG